MRDIIRLNPFTFYGTKVDEYPQGIIDVVFKVVDFMGVNPREKEELASYPLKDVAPVWFKKWRKKRPLQEGPVDWEVFKKDFLYRFFPIDLRERECWWNS